MLYTGDFVLRYYVRFSQIWSHILDLNDIMFFIKSLKNCHDGFIITNYIKFVTGNTRSALCNKLQQIKSTNNTLQTFTLIAYQESGTPYLS